MMTNSFRNSHIEKEYKRWRKKIGAEEPYKGEYIIGIHEVLRAHFLIADFFSDKKDPIGLIGPRDINLLHSSLLRQFTSFEGHEKWTKDTCIVATLLYGLIKNHPFHDGNKRTAFLCALYQLRKCKRTPSASQKEFEKLILAIADNRLEENSGYRKLTKRYKSDPEIYFISNFLHRNTRKIDKHYHQIRFYELKNILKNFGFDLEETSGGKLNIIKYEISRILLFSKKSKKKIGTVKYHTMNDVVSRKTISYIRRITGLTPQNGYDSQVFFQGVDHMQSLIQEYSTLLKRLRDK
ncbi:MAG: type II toxin-antitoxin system death-on-curing family toxin [Candidatus Helarchaeota archaeon]